MAKRDEKTGGSPDTARLLHRQFRLAENARFLRRMPAFAANDEMPQQLNELMSQLDKSENRAER